MKNNFYSQYFEIQSGSVMNSSESSPIICTQIHAFIILLFLE